MSFVGSAPLPGQSFLVSIDGADPFEAQFTQPSNSSSSSALVHRVWYTATYEPTKRPIRLTLSRLPRGLGIDYLVLKAYNNTALLESQLMVDDTASPSVQYNGSWAAMSKLPAGAVASSSGDLAEPFGGGVHSSATVGDSIKIIFQGMNTPLHDLVDSPLILFAGSSISLFSHFTSSGNGTITASYSLDDGPGERRTYTQSQIPSSSSSSAGAVITPNYPLLSLTNLESRLHTLTLTILESTSNATLNLDYFTFKPGYKSLIELLQGENGVETGLDGNGGQGAAQISKGALAGIIVGILGVVVALLWAFCCNGPARFRRMFGRRGRRRGKKKESGSGGDATTDLG